MREKELVMDNLSRAIYGRPLSFLNEDELYHIETEYFGLKEMSEDFPI